MPSPTCADPGESVKPGEARYEGELARRSAFLYRPQHSTCLLIEPPSDATFARCVRTPEYCPNCGAEVPPRARACPECGACEETGWSDRAQGQRLDLPDDEFDYDDFVAREFGGRPLRRRGPQRLWWVVGCLVLLAFLALILR